MAKATKAKNVTIDDLAVMVKHGFDEIGSAMAKKVDVDKHFEEVDKQLANIKMELGHTNTVVAVIRQDISDIKKRFAYLDELEDVLARLSLVEKKVGIVSGK